MRKGSTTIEYVLILPLVFVCVITAVLVFLTFYQKSMVQSLAETTAEGLSMIWGHNPLDPEDITTGSFKKTSYDAKEVYWQIKPGGIHEKETVSEAYVTEKLKGLGVLKTFEDQSSVDVTYHRGFPFSSVEVTIKTAYQIPGSKILRLIGLGNLMTFTSQAEATVFDQKEMINNSDYVIQIVKASKLGDILEKFFKPLKSGLDQFIN